MAGIGIKITGADALAKTLQNLKRGQTKSIFTSTFRKISKPLIKSIRQNIKPHRRSSNLYKSIGLKPIRRRVGVQIGARTYGNFKGYSGHVLDKGTVQRYRTGRNGKRYTTGRVKPTNFFRDAVTDKQSLIFKNIEQEFKDAVLRYVTKQNNKTIRQ